MRLMGVRRGQNYTASGARDGWRPFRRLTLRDSGDQVFLDRWGADLGLFGLYLHRIAEPDPGLDLHDHPWPFASVILWGGYHEEVCDAREAASISGIAEIFGRILEDEKVPRGEIREWRRGSVHRMRLDEAHRITSVRPHTWTLVMRGRRVRSWGFYLPDGWVDYKDYDYNARRPGSEDRHDQ